VASLRVAVDSVSSETDVVYVVGDLSRADGSRLHRAAARTLRIARVASMLGLVATVEQGLHAVRA
jgi:hypothetical protein